MKLVIKRGISSSEGEQEIIGSSNACQIIREKRIATKVLKSSSIDMLVHEYQILQSLNHPHIIRLASSKPFKMVKELNKVGLQLELGHIDLFHFLKQSFPSRLNIATIKDIFMQLGTAIQYLHEEKQIAHNDLKLENIVLFFKKGSSSNDATQINAKLIDFGLASDAQVSISKIYNNWYNRSPNNLAPEIIEQLNAEEKLGAHQELLEEFSNESEEQFNLSKCDVFQFGLTLFNALFLTNAFSYEDGYSSYQNFINNTPENFWNQQYIQQLLNMIKADSSQQQIEQIIDLFNLIFQYNPSARPSMKQILDHSWFKSS